MTSVGGKVTFRCCGRQMTSDFLNWPFSTFASHLKNFTFSKVDILALEKQDFFKSHFWYANQKSSLSDISTFQKNGRPGAKWTFKNKSTLSVYPLGVVA